MGTPSDSGNLNGIIQNVLQSPEFRTELQRALSALTCENEGRPGLSAQPSQTTSASSCSTTSRFTNMEEEIRRLFPSVRPMAASRQSSSVLCIPKKSALKKKRKFKDSFTTFFKDVILLNGPSCKKVLRGSQKVTAIQKGLALNAVKFEKQWSSQQVKEYIKEIFSNHLTAGEEFELLLPVCGSLVAPQLANDEMDGFMLNKVFAQKTVYIRPLTQLSYVQQQVIHATERDSDDGELVAFLEVSDSRAQTNCAQSVPDGVDEHIRRAADQFEVDTTCAIQNSLVDSEIMEASQQSVDVTENNAEPSLENILRKIQENVSKEETSLFNINRCGVLEGCLRGLRRKTFNPLKRVSVMFTDEDGISEGAIDEGGPTREMWRLVLSELKDSNLFVGIEYNKALNLDSESLQKKLYYEAGRIISMSLVHGGPGPQFFSAKLFRIEGVQSFEPTLEDIYDNDIKEQLIGIINAEDLSCLKAAVEKASILLDMCGCNLHITDLKKKEGLIKSALQLYSVDRLRPALEQLEEGLRTLDILPLMKAHPSLFQPVMCFNGTILDCETMKSLFLITYSDNGSNDRTVENMVVGYWREFLQDCFENEVATTLGDVLKFSTGCDIIPPLGLTPHPKLGFLHQSPSRFPIANTCGNVLSLPTVHRSYEEFCDDMVFGMINGMVFGFA